MAEMQQPMPIRRRISPWAWLSVPLLLMVAMPSMILVTVGMVPTLVAAVVDRREEKYAAYCVGGFNLSGVFPYLLILWTGGGGMEAMLGIVGSPFSWLVMYGAAALGWVANYWIPQIVIKVQGMRDTQRIVAMRRRQEELLEEWGNELLPPEDAFMEHED